MKRSHCMRVLVACSTGLGGVAAAQTTYYVNDGCGDDSWLGLSPICQSPDGPKKTIRAAIAVTSDDDRIVVADGVYTGPGNRGILFGGRRIVLGSQNGAEHCIIDAEGAGRIFTMADYLTPETVIEGFTIRNGQATEGGAFWFHHTNLATVRDCIIMNNSAGTGGAVLTRIDSAPTFINCSFIGNSAERGGGVAAVHQSAPVFINCIFFDNAATDEGGAIYGEFVAAPELINTSIAGNQAQQRGAAIRIGAGTLTLRNSIVWGNPGPAPIVVGTAAATVAAKLLVGHSLVEGGQAGIVLEGSGMLQWLGGNVSGDPLFVDLMGGDLRLDAGSAAIDAGDNTALPPEILTDRDGNPRFVDDPATPNTGIPGGAGGSSIVDMGAHEFQGGACYANCDGSTTPPVLNVADFSCFLQRFAAGDPYANCDGSTTPPVLNVADFSCFLQAFAAGCR
jgi:hypothetical protein